ncbi:MAG: lipoyl(octanoyl) transferase LipB [Caldiserica bacterium]|jgi:lipoyl(octanoyl) transferase|nr:lipoyl(octanoyl) transferase LipB [Caldisericota bacterium]MDH7561980.1 lipoyl(octanoyl) transferase LipB [Caldisericota bacterium]
MAFTSSEIWGCDLGLVPYGDAWRLQQNLLPKVLEGKIPDLILFLEHPHVFTLGKHGREENLLVSPEGLKERGVEFFKVDRGGDITYHGPGQLIAYFIFSLQDLRVKRFVEMLEEAVISTLKSFSIPGERIEGKPGVWVGGKKICSIGIALKQKVTQHGLALNVNPDLSFFNLINPCGEPNLQVTSFERELGKPVPLNEVIYQFSHHVKKLFLRDLKFRSREEIWDLDFPS